MGHIYLTKPGYEKLKKELESLKERRPLLVQQLREARALGDLKENAEYHSTKERLAKLQDRLNQLEEKMRIARVIEKSSTDKFLLGSTVYVKNLNTDEDYKYQLVAPEEAEISEGKISVNSPVGEGLFEHRKGDVVEIKIPAGLLKLKIIKIE